MSRTCSAVTWRGLGAKMKPSASASSAVASSASSSFVIPHIFTNIALLPPRDLRRCKFAHQCRGVVRPHERFADENRIEAGCRHALRVDGGAYRRLRDRDHRRRNRVDEPGTYAEIFVERR